MSSKLKVYVPLALKLSSIVDVSKIKGIVLTPRPYDTSLPVGVKTTVTCSPLKFELFISIC